MKPRLNATRTVRDLIKAHEPFVETAERRGRRWVIGWGHRATAREGATITPDNAELLLIYDALQAQQAVDAVVGDELPKSARDALASFAASIGLSAFKVSDVARLAKAARHREAAAALDSWVRAEVDGRLAVSDQLVQRRHAEKALFLEALNEPVAAAPEPKVEPPAAEEPTLGVLVDVDIAFEDAPAAAPVSASVVATPQAEPEGGPVERPRRDLGTSDAEARAAIEATERDSVSDAIEVTAREVTAEPEDAPTEDEPVEPESFEAELVAQTEDALDEEAVPEDNSEALKSRQDAAIKAVMTRMAGTMATSVVPAPQADVPAADEDEDTPQADSAAEASAEPEPEAEPQPDLTDVRLGFSYMEPSRVKVPLARETEDTAVDVGTQPEPELEPAPAPKSEPMPTPVYGTVSVSTVSPSQNPDDEIDAAPVSPEPVSPEPAPPHPAAAPASAPGLSGESEGPDHPDEEDGYHGEDDDILDPVIVAGPEAGDLEFEAKPQKSASWVFPAMMGVGVVMTGLGGWELASNFDAYMAGGISHSPIGPVVFGSGFLLTVGAAWMTLSRR